MSGCDECGSVLHLASCSRAKKCPHCRCRIDISAVHTFACPYRRPDTVITSNHTQTVYVLSNLKLADPEAVLAHAPAEFLAEFSKPPEKKQRTQ